MAEKKSTPYDEVTYSFNRGNSQMSTAYLLSLCLNIPQGAGDGQRIGNKINVTRAMMNYSLRAQDPNSSAGVDAFDSPVEVHIFIGYVKGSRAENWDADFRTSTYNDGNSVLPWNGTNIRTLRRLNTDKFVIKHHVIKKIGTSFTNKEYSSNNDYKLTHRGKINLKELLGSCQYTDDTGLTHNKDLYMSASYVFASDQTGDQTVITVPPVVFDYFIDLEYTDL